MHPTFAAACFQAFVTPMNPKLITLAIQQPRPPIYKKFAIKMSTIIVPKEPLLLLLFC